MSRPNGQPATTPASSDSAAWGALLLVCLPWAACGNCPIEPACAAAVLALVLPYLPLARLALPVAVGVGAYLGAASAPWHLGLPVAGWRLWVAGCAALILLSWLTRRRQALAVTLGATPVWLVGAVLAASPWQRDAQRFARLALALGCGLVAWRSAAHVLRRHKALPRRRVAVAWALCAVLTGLRQGVAPGPATAALPGWRSHVAALPSPPTDVHHAPPEILQQLERLRLSGSGDAALALAAAGTVQAACLQDIAAWCASRGRNGVLGRAWAGWTELGAAACGILSGVPAPLPQAAGSAPALLRLRADAALQRGEGPEALRLLRQAASPWAARQAALWLLATQRPAEAAAWLPPGADPGVDLLLQRAPLTAASFKAYNAQLDFTTLTAAANLGIVAANPVARLRGAFDPTLQRRVLLSDAPPDVRPIFSLPLPPGAVVPQRLRVWARSEPQDLVVELINQRGERVMYRCAAGLAPGVVPWGEAFCQGGWAEAAVDAARYLQGPLRQVLVHGRFAVARIAMDPPEAMF